MATWDDVARLALALPETAEGQTRGTRAWTVRNAGKTPLFVWVRPLGKKDRADLGDAAPDGPILGARTESLVAKEALIADDPDIYFTIPHFDGFPAVLVRLERIGVEELRELIVEAWLARAPRKLADAWAAENLPDPGA